MIIGQLACLIGDRLQTIRMRIGEEVRRRTLDDEDADQLIRDLHSRRHRRTSRAEGAARTVNDDGQRGAAASQIGLGVEHRSYGTLFVGLQCVLGDVRFRASTAATHSCDVDVLYKDVLKLQSQWVYAGAFHANGDSASVNDFVGSNWGSNATTSAEDFKSDNKYSSAQSTWSFTSGVTSSSLGTDDVLRGFDKFEDTDNIEVDFLIAPESLTDTQATTIVNDLVTIAGTTRKDCVAVASPSRAAVVTTGTNAAVLACNNTYTKSSYLVQDNNYLKVFDKYNDKYIKIPAASSTAGLMAATDLVAAPWFSPAGSRRGRYAGITDIILSPTKAERDALYKAGINPIANIPGEGIMLFGDKTNESRPSAFDRINVRRLFLGIERAIAIAGRNVMFEFNDEFTRAEFVNVVEPLLREIRGRRGITDFRVVCDVMESFHCMSIDKN